MGETGETADSTPAGGVDNDEHTDATTTSNDPPAEPEQTVAEAPNSAPASSAPASDRTMESAADLPPPAHLAPPGLMPSSDLPPADLVPRPAGMDEPPPPSSVPAPTESGPKSYPAATIDEIVPISGPVVGSTKLTILGNGISRATIARVGGQLARTLSVHPGNRIVVSTPAAAEDGPVEVTLQNPGHEPTAAAEQFCYLAVPAPRLEAVAPKQVAAAGGSTLTLIGHDFIAHCSVAINGQPVADVVFIDAETVEVMVPPGERGRYGDVSLTNADGQTSSCRRAFIYS